MRNGIHTLCEKPAGVYTAQVQEMNDCARECDVVFGIMYNQRPNPLYQKVKDLIDSGELGEIRRSNWIITNWYRSPELLQLWRLARHLERRRRWRPAQSGPASARPLAVAGGNAGAPARVLPVWQTS